MMMMMNGQERFSGDVEAYLGYFYQSALIRTKNPKNVPPWRQNSGLSGTCLPGPALGAPAG